MRDIARLLLAKAVHGLHTVKVGHRITDSKFAKIVCGRGAVIAELRNGAKALVLVNDYIGRALYLWGEHDPRITSVVETVLQPGDTMLDIGANFGAVGLVAAQKVGPTGSVHMFEPQPLVAQFLRTSVLMNGFFQAEVHECALSDRSAGGEMEVVSLGNLGMTHVSQDGDEVKGQRIRVRVEDANRYLRSLGCAKAALIKIDVEGHEAIILGSMRDWLLETEPGVILFECHLDGGTFWGQETVRILSEIGYEFLAYDLTRIWRNRLYPVPRGMRKPAGHDFVAVRRQGPGSESARRLDALVTI
ncbi:MAG: FkbM family methyltransferase [Bryobacteraceae bacterium]